MKLGARDLTIR